MKNIVLPNGEYACGDILPEGAFLVDEAPPSQNPPSMYRWEKNKWVFKGYSPEQAMKKFKQIRNNKLAETDWEMTKALETGADATALKEYRQDLRDLPSTAKPELDENGQLTGVTWPSKPD